MKLGKWMVISFVVLIGMFFVANLIFYSNLGNEVIEVKEGQLNKNKGLTVLPGEKYSYEISEENGVLEFNLVYGYNCIEVYIFDQPSGVCLKSDGTDQTGSNMTLGHPQIAFFKPWMLALEDEWSWKVEYWDKNTNSSMIGYYFKVIGKEEIYGREAYVVNIIGVGLNVTEWIDKDKRILLKEAGGEYELEIVDAPFELEKN